MTLAREGAQIVVTDVCETIPSVIYPLATEEDLAGGRPILYYH